jgi:ATP-dependent RNA helicase DDX5/DBP2
MPRKTFDTDDEERVDTHVVEKKRKREEKAPKAVTNESSADSEKAKKKAEKKKEKKKRKEEKAAELKAAQAKEDKKGAKEEKAVEGEKKATKDEKKAAKEEKVAKKGDQQEGKVQEQKTKATQLDNADTEAWRSSNNMTIAGEDCPPPYRTFEEAPFPPAIQSTLKTLKFSKPTPIQSQCWPLALAGRDMIGLAETGSGKTLAFMLPGIVHITNKTAAERAKGPSVLVLAPTRELAQQIEEVTAKTCGAVKIKSVCVYGGVAKGDQAAGLKGAEVIIATPGRLMDFMDGGTVRLQNISYLVFDEADRMLDMGFEMQINAIMRQITSPVRQTLMFSATWPDDVRRLSQKFFKKPIKVTIGSENLTGAKKVTQIVEVIAPHERKNKLTNLLTRIFKDNCRILIFMLYKKSCQAISETLEREGWPVVSIHGDKSQIARNQALADFKTGKTPIMIATDVAARGLDIKEVKYVINVEFPLKCEDYVHRIGRTGRAGESGTAYTFFTAEENQHARELVQIMQESGQEVDPKMLALADNAPGIKPKKTAMQQLYGDFAKADPSLAGKKATRIVFDD